MIHTLSIDEFCPSDELTIWDVRDAEQYQAGHIEHAQNRPLATLGQSALNENTNKIYILCGGGTKALRACELLESLDPNRTYVHLTGGTRKAVALGMTIISEN